MGFPLHCTYIIRLARAHVRDAEVVRAIYNNVPTYIRALCIFIKKNFISNNGTPPPLILLSVIRRQYRLAHARTIIIIQMDASRARARVVIALWPWGINTASFAYIISYTLYIHIIYELYTYRGISLCTGSAYRHFSGADARDDDVSGRRSSEPKWIFDCFWFFSLLSGHSKPAAARIKKNRFSTDV